MTILGAWSQTVSIGTVSDAAVEGVAIREQSRAPITDIEFTVEDSPVTRSTFDALALDEEVKITQTGNGVTRKWTARITGLTYERGTNWTQAKVRCETLETLAKRRRIFGEYSGNVSTVVADIWADWGTWIASGTDIEALSPGVSITFKWDSLFSALDEIARRFDFAWNIDADNDQLVFFDPSGRSSPDISQAAGDIVGKTATIKSNGEDIVNTVIASGWVYRTVTESITMPTGFGIFALNVGCRRGFHSRQIERLMRQDEWELVGAEITEDFAAQDIADDRETEVWDNGWLVFDPSLIPATQMASDDLRKFVEFSVVVTFRKRAQELVTNDASITRYGRRDGEPITDDGGQTLEEALERAQVVVNARAFPTIEADMELTAIGPAPDTVARLTMYEPTIDRNLYVESVDHSTRGNELTVTVNMSGDDP